ncbi:hypothetical protein PFICI_08030 [Pestalotiopsis fici W106-1]|uniref:NCT transcriptional regulatory complex subunit A n=1 Tax=Pestalotiopsis fici (strain W106-1 / CGMCC3.15140) TaxID=1229662 RepID=W3X5P1_PESFW|nr:uncharacterized protein PFICI_08030 [Pestalotiopsis fici W106-1]ETS80501.1 hypothetical protein PFICI_08030 [Pestalotiopsis fici W106-1]
MSSEEGTYAPKSPDLSSFLSGGSDPNLGRAASFTSAPNPNSLSGYSPSSSTYSSHQHQHQPASHYGQPQQPHQTYSSSPATAYNNYHHSYTAPSPSSVRSQQPYFSSPQQPTNLFAHAQSSLPAYILSPQQQHSTPPSHSGPQPYYANYAESPINHYLPPQSPQLVQQHGQLQPSHFPPAYDHKQPQPAQDSAAVAMPPRKSAAAQVAQQPEIMPSPVRTKFPTARIKRIMQADEEVGKVAQQTPIAVGKALELFMVQIVSKSADVAKDKNSKRITAQMLKQAVENNPQWDFLQEITAKVSEKEEREPKGKKASENTDSDEDLDAEPKKKGRGGRKKKAAS